MSNNNSYEQRRRQRAANRTLATWHQELVEIVSDERQKRGLPSDHGAALSLAMEMARRPVPTEGAVVDAVIPGTRTDLARRWAQGRLDGRLAQDLDAEIAPLPDSHLRYIMPRRTAMLYASDNRLLDRISDLTEQWIKKGAVPFDAEFRVRSLCSSRSMPWANLS